MNYEENMESLEMRTQVDWMIQKLDSEASRGDYVAMEATFMGYGHLPKNIQGDIWSIVANIMIIGYRNAVEDKINSAEESCANGDLEQSKGLFETAYKIGTGILEDVALGEKVKKQFIKMYGEPLPQHRSKILRIANSNV